MDPLAALAAEKEAAAKSARDSGLSPKSFGVFWALREDQALAAASIEPLVIAREVEALMGRFPNAGVNADERRRLRANLYRPLLPLTAEERARVVDLIIATLFV